MKVKKVCFLVGSVALSGGTYVIFQHAGYLHEQGYDVTLAVQEPFDASTFTWHDQAGKLRIIPFLQAQNESFDLVIATWWRTSLDLPAFKADRYAYFVQSIESRFYSERERSLRALVDATYDLPVFFITEAGWIVDYLEKVHNQNAILVRNGIRKDIYLQDGNAIEPKSDGALRVLVEGPFNVPFKNTAFAIKLARKAGVREIWVMTGSPVHWLPGVKRVFSRVPIHKTPEIYRSCDVLLKLSTVEGMFGPPLEMFHCGGTALVFDVTGHEEYIQAGENALVVTGGKSVVSQLRMLLSDKDRLTSLKTKAMETADAWPDWNESSEKFRQWVEYVLQSHTTDQKAVRDVIQTAWTHYTSDKNRHIKDIFWILLGYKLEKPIKKLIKRSPSRLLDEIQQLRALLEVLLHLII
uniref:Glycosyltransferase involved in cell wall bisynthesis n=1 Tax=Candidatus Kentrum sp. LPFa TaxID=2126335 RepID=A0A450W3Y8_9GAMM|nr:MAG: Glycosyltransferase involved in cell wall bisynthesis [Candidatus Kentron sp. LPFa]